MDKIDKKLLFIGAFVVVGLFIKSIRDSIIENHEKETEIIAEPIRESVLPETNTNSLESNTNMEDGENEVPEPAKKYKQCPICAGLTRCSVCGGSGQTFSVFDGDEVVDGRYIDCKSCGGSGACSFCEGTGYVEDFSWN